MYFFDKDTRILYAHQWRRASPFSAALPDTQAVWGRRLDPSGVLSPLLEEGNGRCGE